VRWRRSRARNRTTVGQIRRELEEKGGVSIIDTRADSAGRQQPARKFSPHARPISHEKLAEIPAEAPKEADAPVTIGHVADQKDALRVLEDATRFLSQRRSEVLAVPRPVRLMQAMAIIDALGLGIDDLVVGWPR
jgi:hypothetical protein